MLFITSLAALTFYASAVTQTFIYDTKLKQLSLKRAVSGEENWKLFTTLFATTSSAIKDCADKMHVVTAINLVMIPCVCSWKIILGLFQLDYTCWWICRGYIYFTSSQQEEKKHTLSFELFSSPLWPAFWVLALTLCSFQLLKEAKVVFVSHLTPSLTIYKKISVYVRNI